MGFDGDGWERPWGAEPPRARYGRPPHGTGERGRRERRYGDPGSRPWRGGPPGPVPHGDPASEASHRPTGPAAGGIGWRRPGSRGAGAARPGAGREPGFGEGPGGWPRQGRGPAGPPYRAGPGPGGPPGPPPRGFRDRRREESQLGQEWAGEYGSLPPFGRRKTDPAYGWWYASPPRYRGGPGEPPGAMRPERGGEYGYARSYEPGFHDASPPPEPPVAPPPPDRRRRRRRR